MVSGQVNPSETSLTNCTVGVEQLSASSVTTLISATGTSSIQITLIAIGLLAVGATVSLIIISWVTVMLLLQASVTL